MSETLEKSGIMDNNDKSMVHLINKKGERKVVSWAELQKENESQSDDTFYLDTEWYLSHGYVTHEQHMKKVLLESRQYLKEQLCLKNEYTVEEARTLTKDAFKKLYNSLK